MHERAEPRQFVQGMHTGTLGSTLGYSRTGEPRRFAVLPFSLDPYHLHPLHVSRPQSTYTASLEPCPSELFARAPAQIAQPIPHHAHQDLSDRETRHSRACSSRWYDVGRSARIGASSRRFTRALTTTMKTPPFSQLGLTLPCRCRWLPSRTLVDWVS